MSGASKFVEAIPANGDLIHAKVAYEPMSWAYPEQHAKSPASHLGRLMWGVSLCGVRGRDAWGMGGMLAVLDESGEPRAFDHENPVPPKEGWNGGVVNVTCPTCVSRVRSAKRKEEI